jgi:hypothetical protein
MLGDLDETLPEDEIVRRKVDAINAWVDYAWKIEPKEPTFAWNLTGTQISSRNIANKLRHLRPTWRCRDADLPSRRRLGTRR